MTSKGILLATAASIVIGATALAGKGSATDNELSFRILDETAPPGGMVQMKLRTTEVTPISGGRGKFSFSPAMFAEVAGFGMFAAGEIAGAAVIDGTHVEVSHTTNGALTGEYPILTVALRIRPDVAFGTRTLFSFDPRSTWGTSLTGPIFATKIAPGAVTVGGTVSITDVVPGEGLWPAGTVVSVKGVGFDGRTRLRVNDVAIRAVRVVNPNEMQFTLAQAVEMRGLRLKAESPENTDIYYAYMRGIPSTVSTRTLLAATEPIFAVTPRAVASFGPFPARGASQYAALALQNPNRADVAIGMTLFDAGGGLIYRSARTVASQHRLTMELSELLDGVTPPPGSSVVVRASAPIDVIGLLCDEGLWTVSPSLPREAQR